MDRTRAARIEGGGGKEAVGRIRVLQFQRLRVRQLTGWIIGDSKGLEPNDADDRVAVE